MGFTSWMENIMEKIKRAIPKTMKIAFLNIAGYYSQSYKLQGVINSVQNTIIDSVLFPVLCKEKHSLFERARNLNNIVAFLFTNLCFLLIYY